jgi:hypothetical protein
MLRTPRPTDPGEAEIGRARAIDLRTAPLARTSVVPTSTAPGIARIFATSSSLRRLSSVMSLPRT